MRLSDLMGKEVVNLLDGSRLGTVGDSDLVIDELTGNIESILLPGRGRMLSILGDQQHIVIPWECVRKIGSEFIVVEMDETYGRLFRKAY